MNDGEHTMLKTLHRLVVNQQDLIEDLVNDTLQIIQDGTSSPSAVILNSPEVADQIREEMRKVEDNRVLAELVQWADDRRVTVEFFIKTSHGCPGWAVHIGGHGWVVTGMPSLRTALAAARAKLGRLESEQREDDDVA